MAADYEQTRQQWETACDELQEVRRGMVEALRKMSPSTPVPIGNQILLLCVPKIRFGIDARIRRGKLDG
jgi:hypothetical protein